MGTITIYSLAIAAALAGECAGKLGVLPGTPFSAVRAEASENAKLFEPPPDTAIPADKLGEVVKFGEKIFRETEIYAPQFVGNELRRSNREGPVRDALLATHPLLSSRRVLCAQPWCDKQPELARVRRPAHLALPSGSETDFDAIVTDLRVRCSQLAAFRFRWRPARSLQWAFTTRTLTDWDVC